MKTRRRFSIIELIIVITIMLILIALLLPILGRAKETSRRVVCQSNHRQLFQANVIYAKDHARVYSPCYTNWNGTRWPSYMYEYYETVELLWCPSDKKKRWLVDMFENPDQTASRKVLNNGGNDDAPTGYNVAFGMNYNLGSPRYVTYSKMLSPANTPMFGDDLFYRLQYPSGWETWYYPKARHFEKANFVMADGHTKEASLEESEGFQWSP